MTTSLQTEAVVAKRPPNHVALYALANVVFVLMLICGAAVTDAANPRLLSVALLFAICSTPIVFVRTLNGRYVILSAILAMYFLLFGASDALAMMLGGAPSQSLGILSPAELVVIAGGVLLVAGYRLAVVPAVAARPGAGIKDWSTSSVVVAGVVLWAVGAAASWIWQVYRYRTATEVDASFTAAGSTVLVVARLLHPLGMLLLGYALAITRNRLLLILVLGAICVDVVIGFIGDTKELALRGVLLVIFARVLTEGRLPKIWLACGFVFVILAFPIFQAYRANVVGARGLSRAQAAEDIGRSIELALQSQSRLQVSSEYHAPSFLERNNVKPLLEQLIAKVGVEARYQEGDTLALFFIAFVPRVVWPDKPDISVGQKFNRELHLAENPDVYLTPSFLGDLYWNYGWGGVICGMPILGYLLGFVNRRCDMAQRRSVSRLLVLATTIYLLCFRIEDGIALEGIVWVRTLVAVGVMHLVFARRRIPSSAAAESGGTAEPGERQPPLALPRFSNLMR